MSNVRRFFSFVNPCDQIEDVRKCLLLNLKTHEFSFVRFATQPYKSSSLTLGFFHAVQLFFDAQSTPFKSHDCWFFSDGLQALIFPLASDWGYPGTMVNHKYYTMGIKAAKAVYCFDKYEILQKRVYVVSGVVVSKSLFKFLKKQACYDIIGNSLKCTKPEGFDEFVSAYRLKNLTLIEAIIAHETPNF